MPTLVQFAVMCATEWYRELVAYLAPQRWGLRNLEMMCV
jgi:hypothetical protein